jgi:transcriptional regulator with XRE-family HTH domain
MARRKKEEESGLIKQLKDEIHHSGMSLYQIGTQAGISLSMLTRFMSGERSLTLPAAEKICRALRLDLTRRPEAPPTEKRRRK